MILFNYFDIIFDSKREIKIHSISEHFPKSHRYSLKMKNYT